MEADGRHDGRDDGPDDDVVLRRSWDELHAHAIRRGTRLRRRRRVLAAAPIVIVVVALIAGLLAARGDDDPVDVRIADEPPRLSQPVAFVRIYEGGDGGSAIFVVNADGSGLRELSKGRDWNDGSPAYSPDGRWIAFQSERDNALRGVKRNTDIYLMRPDGTGVRRLTVTTDPGLGNGVRHPAWSPDAARLAVARENEADSSQIVVMRPDGTAARAITDGPGDVGPAWSPDGDRIVFRRRPLGAANEELWVVRPDGTGARQVLPKIHDGTVAWAPDGRLTFAEDLPDGTIRLFTVDLDGSGRRQVSAGPGATDLDPVWSADGRGLVHWTDPDGQYLVDREATGTVRTSGGRRPGRLVFVKEGGKVLRFLTSPADGDHDYSPSLGPVSGRT